MQEILEKKFAEAVRKAFPDAETTVEVTLSTQPGVQYQFNSALKMGKALKKNPREVAQTIVQHFDPNGIVEPLEVAGPGFVNIRISKEFLEKKLSATFADERLGIPKPEHPQRVIVEFSSPNTAKEMHVGHLRSTIIGDSLARLFEFLGHDVLRLNHIGDWGTQFGMLIAFIKAEHSGDLANTHLPQLMQWYQASKKKFDADPEFKKQAQNEVVALQKHDPVNLKLWEKICSISREGYQEIYDLLDIHLQERGESFYNPMLPKVVEDLEKKGLITVSDGAKCVFIEGYKVPLMVQKSDGGYNYDTTDMAALLQRVNEEKADRIIMVVDQGQALHFNLVLAAAQLAGYYDPRKVHIEHIPFGLVLGAEGKKFRTRSGETEKLIDLLLTAVEKAESVIREKNPELSEKEAHDLAHVIGISAVKYADLSNHRVSDYQFSYDKMLRFEGNTAPYLLYAYVRCRSIERQAEKKASSKITLSHPQEMALALKLLQFIDVLYFVEKELLPHRLSEYLYELSDQFSAFFRDCRVIGSPEEESRLALVSLVGRTLKQGLNLLGIQTVEKM